jgi:hexosaminidase
MRSFLLSFVLVAAVSLSWADCAFGFVTELRQRGYALIPAPQQVELKAGDVSVSAQWVVETRGSLESNIAVQRLTQGMQELHGVAFSGEGDGKIVLKIAAGTVKGTDDPELLKQAYRLTVTPGRVEITGNDAPGLFYGVQSFLQLLRRGSFRSLSLPVGTITDWPDLQLRFAHWDSKHHQKRIDTLKRLIDWLAYFKVNMIGFEMEDKYEYPSHPDIGAPGAYTKEQMQELTRYALERHVQLVPVIQSPAHVAYVLKHPQYAHLAADGCNYQICMCDPEAVQLIFDLYDDMIEATPGVEYFHVSTDEVYYAGTCDKCEREYNEVNRSQAWIDFALQAHEFLAARGRTMLAWVEYPVLPEHILQLPPDLIDGVMGGNQEFLDMEKTVGIRQLAYASTQGAEFLFPNLLPTTYRGRSTRGRVEGNAQTVQKGLAMGANPIGSFAAAWDDSGLHEETFWLGWVSITQYAWTHSTPSPQQTTADFMDVFYGPGHRDMVEIYNLLIQGARFFEDGLERVISSERNPGYGNSDGKGIHTERYDQLLVPPSLPDPSDLSIEPVFSSRYEANIERASSLLPGNDRLLAMLNRNLTSLERNRYNLEVYLSIAQFERHFIETLLELGKAEQSLVAAGESAAKGDHSRAVNYMVEANNSVTGLLEQREWMWSNLTRVWEKSRFEKGRSVDGRGFVHVLDDLKDHWADRRPGLDYMMAPYQRMQLPAWRRSLVTIIDNYAAEHKVPVRGLAVPRLED